MGIEKFASKYNYRFFVVGATHKMPPYQREVGPVLERRQKNVLMVIGMLFYPDWNLELIQIMMQHISAQICLIVESCKFTKHLIK
jgi:hypothetical protein